MPKNFMFILFYENSLVKSMSSVCHQRGSNLDRSQEFANTSPEKD